MTVQGEIVLDGNVVRLEPLTMAHVPALSDVALDPELWRWTLSQVRTREDMTRYVEKAIAMRDAGVGYPFATIERRSGRVVGSTRFQPIEPGHRRLEIGYTFVARPWQRTAVNTEAKYLMMKHAFELMNMHRVEFKTDVLNTTSRNALRRIGAVEEGILREHSIAESGRIRDTIYYSVLEQEWPDVRAVLERRLHDA